VRHPRTFASRFADPLARVNEKFDRSGVAPK
jgi:hypothetical protein